MKRKQVKHFIYISIIAKINDTRIKLGINIKLILLKLSRYEYSLKTIDVYLKKNNFSIFIL